jgi:hypothetical protein
MPLSNGFESRTSIATKQEPAKKTKSHIYSKAFKPAKKLKHAQTVPMDLSAINASFVAANS